MNSWRTKSGCGEERKMKSLRHHNFLQLLKVFTVPIHKSSVAAKPRLEWSVSGSNSIFFRENGGRKREGSESRLRPRSRGKTRK